MRTDHALIGCIVSLLLNIHELVGQDEVIPIWMCNWFSEESNKCDHKYNNMCNHSNKTAECKVGRCPLGAELDSQSVNRNIPSITEYILANKGDERWKV